jgi:hypothetical protein
MANGYTPVVVVVVVVVVVAVGGIVGQPIAVRIFEITIAAADEEEVLTRRQGWIICWCLCVRSLVLSLYFPSSPIIYPIDHHPPSTSITHHQIITHHHQPSPVSSYRLNELVFG